MSGHAMTRALRGTVIALVLGVVLVVSAGCGYGEPDAEGAIAKTADDYLRALAAGETGKACAQLTADAKAALERPCPQEMRAVARRIGPDELRSAADGGVDIAVDDTRGSAKIRDLAGARLVLVKVGTEWRIASGQWLEP